MFRGSGHYIGMFFMGVIVLAVLGLSLTLSITFFQGITPISKPWFPYLGLSLTEGGFACWMFAFILLRFHGFHTAVALIMSILSFLGIVCTAGIELFSLMPGTTVDLHQALFANAAGGMLDIIFLANLLSTPLAFIVHYTEKNPGWFTGNGNLIPAYPQHYYVAQENDSRPLALSRPPEPKEEPITLAKTATVKTKTAEPEPETSSVAAAIREGVSTVTSKVKDSMKSGKRAGRVPGKTNATTLDTTSTNGVPTDDPLEV